MFKDGKYSAERVCSIWNGKHSNKEALTVNCRGYRRGRVLGDSYLAHRIAWAVYHGWWPEYEVDHINRNRSDNRIKNLREATRTENTRNKTIQLNNKSGFCGVRFHKKDKKWTASIGVHRKLIHLGNFTDIEDAIVARKSAEIEHGFFSGHGTAPNAEYLGRAS